MGLIVLHSGHHSKVFKRLMGTPANLHWREAGERERLWVVNPGHPIAKGLPEYFELENEEMYGEPFTVPEPLETVFVSWFQGGEVFRSGLTYRRGAGNIFYFRPGHETYPTYHDATVGKVLRNAVNWAFNAERHESLMKAPNRPVDEGDRTDRRARCQAPEPRAAVGDRVDGAARSRAQGRRNETAGPRHRPHGRKPRQALRRHRGGRPSSAASMSIPTTSARSTPSSGSRKRLPLARCGARPGASSTPSPT